jgi:hypothetical protein
MYAEISAIIAGHTFYIFKPVCASHSSPAPDFGRVFPGSATQGGAGVFQPAKQGAAELLHGRGFPQCATLGQAETLTPLSTRSTGESGSNLWEGKTGRNARRKPPRTSSEPPLCFHLPRMGPPGFLGRLEWKGRTGHVKTHYFAHHHTWFSFRMINTVLSTSLQSGPAVPSPRA